MTDLFSEQKVIHGDCLDVMKEMESCSIDCIVTDPPYGLSFMGKDWDHGIPGVVFWKEALRVIKPGGILLAFGGTRTYHRLTCAIEDAGFEIRDCIMWLYGSGFPKSHDVSKAIDKSKGLTRESIGIRPGHEGFENNESHSPMLNDDRPWRKDPEKIKAYHTLTAPNSDLAKTFGGYGTALKPAYEPIIVAMRPCDGTFANNAEKWGVAGINIDECRIDTKESWIRSKDRKNSNRTKINCYDGGHKNIDQSSNGFGRWPANVILDEEAAALLGEPARFFYCAKASSSERNAGLDGMDMRNQTIYSTMKGTEHNSPNRQSLVSNHHPTVKPIKLMEYLLKLVMPPFQEAVVLDPFAGSGSTLVAAKNLGFNAIGIEKEAEYCEIANRRIA